MDAHDSWYLMFDFERDVRANFEHNANKYFPLLLERIVKCLLTLVSADYRLIL